MAESVGPVPVLIFNCPPNSGEQHLRFVENTLKLHDSPKLKKFYLEYGYLLVKDPQFTTKVDIAVRKCVEELFLICHGQRRLYWLPKSLLDNAQLVRLAMVNCHFKPEWRVNWPSLKSLKICYGERDMGSKGIENVVSGSPLLECFEFHGKLLNHVAIVSATLKVLSFVDVVLPKTMKISCPNLVEFNVVVKHYYDSSAVNQMIQNVLSGSPIIHSLKLANCADVDDLVIASKSLKVLHLENVEALTIEISCPNLEKLNMLSWGLEDVKAVNLPSSACVTLDIQVTELDESFEELLKLVQHVNRLTMESTFFTNVSKIYDKGCVSLPLLRIKCLTLNVCGDFGSAILGIAYALHTTVLETLVIKLNSKLHEGTSDKDRSDYWDSSRFGGLSCLVSHLITVEISGMYENDDKCKLVLRFIEFLLKNARVLRKMTVSLEKSRKGFVIEVSQKLLSFPRCSQCANVELLYFT